jgi:elongator complex protein 4
MSFQKRGIAIRQAGFVSGREAPGTNATPGSSPAVFKQAQLPTGTRPSPLDGRLTTSTGTRSLDTLLASHSGLALGTSLLVEESGTTDFGGSLLKYYVAEGVVQGHTIHVLGVPEAWGRELPGLGTGDDGSKSKKKVVDEDKMKIAWRYERLGDFSAGTGSSLRGGWSLPHMLFNSKYKIILSHADEISCRKKCATIKFHFELESINSLLS